MDFNLNINKFDNEDSIIKCCEKCGDKIGIIINVLGVKRIVPIICSCRKKELEELQKLEEKKELDRRISLLIEQGIMDKQFLNNIFTNDNGTNIEVLNICKKYVERWQEMKKENIGIIFYGDVGRGKTFYASCIANELFKNGISICITSFPKIIDKLMNFSEESKLLIEKVKSQSLLVIDDFGVERETEYVSEQIFKILDDRLRVGLPTIITTNINISQLKEPKNLTQSRIYSRILEMCTLRVLVDNQNNREEKTNKKREIAKKLLLS